MCDVTEAASICFYSLSTHLVGFRGIGSALGERSLWWGVCVIGHMISMTARPWDTVPSSVLILEERYVTLPQQVCG